LQNRYPSGWYPTPLILCNLLGLALMTSWLLEPTRSLWLALDAQVFWAMNDSLRWGSGWQILWAIANNRAFDLVAAAFMGMLFVHQALWADRGQLKRYIALGLFMLLTVLITAQIGKALPIERPSATAQFTQALHLSELVPQIPTKDYSGDSFPGDHGLALLLCAGFAFIYLPRLHALLAAFFMFAFTLPRLMSGAHWLTDEIVGALAIGAIVLGWLFATPLHNHALGWFERRLGIGSSE
jgi:membrane-associated phospholipid phosphatase